MGFAPGFDPLLIILWAIPGTGLYLFYLYTLSRTLIKCGLPQKLLIVAILIVFVIVGPRIVIWELFGPASFLVGLFRPPIPLSALGTVFVLAFAKWNTYDNRAAITDTEKFPAQ